MEVFPSHTSHTSKGVQHTGAPGSEVNVPAGQLEQTASPLVEVVFRGHPVQFTGGVDGTKPSEQ